MKLENDLPVGPARDLPPHGPADFPPAPGAARERIRWRRAARDGATIPEEKEAETALYRSILRCSFEGDAE